MLGGLDWTQTFLGDWFRTQNQVLFFFAAIIFVVSVALHLFSIEEEQYSPPQERGGEAAGTLPPAAPVNVLDGGVALFPEEVQSEHELSLDFLGVDMVRSKSDSVLHVPDAALDLEPELPFLPDIEPSIFHDGSYPSTPRSSSQELPWTRLYRLASVLRETAKEDATLLDNHLNEAKVPNGSGSPPKDSLGGYTRVAPKPTATSGSMKRRRHMFHRQASSTFSYYGKIGSNCYRYRRANAVVLIKPSRSMSDLYDLQKQQRQRCRHRNQSGATTSSGDTESEEGEGETTVRLLWLSMLKMPKELTRLCLCHLLTWFSVIAEAVFYTDFMGQVIFEGDPKVSARGPALGLGGTATRGQPAVPTARRTASGRLRPLPAPPWCPGALAAGGGQAHGGHRLARAPGAVVRGPEGRHRGGAIPGPDCRAQTLPQMVVAGDRDPLLRARPGPASVPWGLAQACAVLPGLGPDGPASTRSLTLQLPCRAGVRLGGAADPLRAAVLWRASHRGSICRWFQSKRLACS